MFQVGDRVKRARGYSHPEFNMYLGQTYTVKEIVSSSSIILEEADRIWSTGFFELVELKKRTPTGFGKFIRRVEHG